jgi:hypothetical protein
MRFYNQQHRFYCGVDLHARTLSLHILDAAGKTVLATTIVANPDAFLQAVAPFRDGLAVACECMFAGTGSPICAWKRRFPSSWGTPCT